MVKAAAERVGAYYYFFPEYAQGRKAVWEGRNKEGIRFLDMIPKELIKRESNIEMRIEYKNGSIIRIVGTDEKDRFMGTNPIGCVFSEYSLQNPDAFAFVSPILNENDGWLIINGTPRGHNHMYDLEQKVMTLPTWHVSVLTVDDIGEFYDDRYKAQVAEDMFIHGPEFVNQEYYVSYLAGVKGAYYADQIVQARAEGRIAPFPYENHRWVDTFWDLGFNDSTAIWFRQLDGTKVRWIDYHEENGFDLAHYVQILKQKGYRYRTCYLPHDGSSHSLQTMYSNEEVLRKCLREAGMADVQIQTCLKMKPIEGINGIRKRFGNYCFNSDSDSVMDGLHKLELYHKKYDSKRQVYLDVPVHDFSSHAADAIRTELSALEMENRTYTTGQTNRLTVVSAYDNMYKSTDPYTRR